MKELKQKLKEKEGMVGGLKALAVKETTNLEVFFFLVFSFFFFWRGEVVICC